MARTLTKTCIALLVCWALECSSSPSFYGLNRGSATPDVTFVTGQTLGTLRNNYSGLVGCYITIGAAPITVKALGRWVVSGNAGSHTLYIHDTSLALKASATVATSGAPSGQFVYAAVTPVVLSAGASYFISSSETNGGDQWYNDNTILTHTAVASVIDAHYDGALDFVGTNHSYVPLSFKYAP